MLHMLEDHAIDFIEKWKIRSGVYDGMMGRVESQFIMSSDNSKLHIA